MAMPPARAPQPMNEPQASISAFGRIVGVFFSPKSTFEDIVRKPTWLLPLILIAAIAASSVMALNQHFDWRAYMVQQIDKNPRTASLSADQKQQQVEIGVKWAPVSAYVFGILLPPLGMLVIAALLMVAMNLMAGAGANYKTSLSIVTHAFVPASVVGTLLFITVLFLKPVGSFDLDNPVATNAAVFLPEDAAKWLVALCKNIDLLEFWKVLLLGIGFAAVNPRKLKGAKALNIVLTLFLVYVVLRTGIAFIFS